MRRLFIKIDNFSIKAVISIPQGQVKLWGKAMPKTCKKGLKTCFIKFSFYRYTKQQANEKETNGVGKRGWQKQKE